MNMNTNELRELIETLFYVAVTVILPILTTYGAKFIKEKADAIYIETGNKMADKAIKDAQKLIVDAVVQTAQTYSDNCKEESKDGKLTTEQAQEAFNKTRNTVYALLSDEARKYIALAYGNVDRWLTTQIEVAVAKRNATAL